MERAAVRGWNDISKNKRRRIFELLRFSRGTEPRQGTKNVLRLVIGRSGKVSLSLRYEDLNGFRKRYRSPPETRLVQTLRHGCRGLPNRVAACSCSVVILRLTAITSNVATRFIDPYFHNVRFNFHDPNCALAPRNYNG